MNPTLFISHGAPNIILGNSITKNNIKKFTQTLEKPKYIIIISAHYLTKDLKVMNYETDGLMYDFYGFENELYNFKYEIKSDKKVTLDLIEKLKNENIDITIDKNRTTYDHGVWNSLVMMYESLDIPVIQLSIPMNYSVKQLINLGEKLQIFKDEAMIICSGGITHNLSDMSTSSNIKPYAKDFNDYILSAITKGEEQKLLDIQNSEIFLKNHPSREHFLPLYIAFGNAINKKGLSFNHEITYSNISMECFVFDK